MGQVADRLAALTVEVTSPDGRVKARGRAGNLETLRLRPGTYDLYTEAELAHQLARTAVLLYTGHERGVRQIMDAAGIDRATEPSQARDEAEKRYLEELRTLSVVGSGPRRLIRFKISGMADWRCRIAGGTLARLSEPDFLAETAEAARDLLRKNGLHKGLLRHRILHGGRIDLDRERLRAGELRRSLTR